MDGTQGGHPGAKSSRRLVLSLKPLRRGRELGWDTWRWSQDQLDGPLVDGVRKEAEAGGP